MPTYLCTVDLVSKQLQDINFAIDSARAMSDLKTLSELLRLRFDMIIRDWDIPINIGKNGEVE